MIILQAVAIVFLFVFITGVISFGEAIFMACVVEPIQLYLERRK